MREELLRELLDAYKNGHLNITDALGKLKNMPYEDMDYVKIDHHRELRKGFPEVIFCQGKTEAQIMGIMKKMNENNSNILGTRIHPDSISAILKEFPHALYYQDAGMIYVENHPLKRSQSSVLVVTGGTSDIKVAEEASVTAELLGCSVKRLYDVGVAGIHRLFSHKNLLEEASVIIVIAGMEGALASVVGGLVDKPVVAVPTSVGYGASFGGLAALLAMLNTCASGVSVMNIDNGFGAGYFAATILRQIDKKH